MLDPTKMCRNHLLGEHKECHQLVGSINKGKFASVAGHAKRLQIDTSKLIARHDELANEMKRRGMNHKSPLPYFDPIDVGDIDVEANLDDLCGRCTECASRFNYFPGKGKLRQEPQSMTPIPMRAFTENLEKKWYALQVAPGKETKVRKEIYKEALKRDLEELVGRTLSPAMKVVEVRNGKRHVSTRLKMPGYLLTEIVWCDDVHYLLRDIEGAFGLIGHPNPVPLKPEEIEPLLLDEKATRQAPTKIDDKTVRKHVIEYDVGNEVEIKHGTYKGVIGKVKRIETDDEAGDRDPKAWVTISVLGMPTDLEVDYWMVVKH